MMNSKKLSIALVVFAMLAVMLIGTASACTNTDSTPKPIQCPQPSYCSYLKLPTSPVTVTVSVSALDVFPFTDTFSGIQNGYDVTNTGYVAYCADLETTITIGTAYTDATLSSSLCNPQCGTSAEWNEVNYILNNNNGNGQDIQTAIWLVFGFTNAQIQALPGFSTEPSKCALQMYHDALCYSHCCFDACFDKIIAVIVCVPGQQTTIIELKNPCCCSWGCYWNQRGCNWGN
jgi:hypothetical protein